MPTLRIAMKQEWQGQQVRNVFHYAGGDATHDNAQAIVDQIREIWADNLAVRLTEDWKLTGATVKELSDPGNPTIEYTLTDGVLVGGDHGEPASAQVAALLRHIAYTARPNRGRTYFAGLAQAYLVDGRWISTIVDALNDFGSGLYRLPSDLGLGIAWVITRVEPNTGVLVGSNIIERWVGIDVPATQRRRRLGVGI